MKKGMKKLTAFILLAVMLLQTLPVIAFASVGAMKLTVSSVNGIAGDTVEVTVDISNNPGIASLVFNVEYDSALTLKGVEFNSAFGPYVTTPPTYTNPQTVTLISPLQDVSVNGTLATFTFEVGANVTDGYEAYVNVSFAEKNIFNSENELVATVAENGKVSVFRGIAGDINSDREVDTRDAILLFRYVAGWDVDVDPFALDCNGDGDIDTKDAITLFRYIAEWPDIKLYYGVTCAHKLTLVESKDASCTENGNVAYWHCSYCGGNYADVNGENKLDTTVVPALGHAMTYNAANSATCTQNGNVEYWHCSNCELNFADENGETVLSKTVITAEGHNLTKISEKAASCTESGNVTYWYCEICKKNFADEDATRELGDATVSASGHKLSFVEAKEATHIADGNVAYWYCTACKCCFTDDSASTEITVVVIPATGHGEMLEHVEAKDATVYEKGNEEYWYCPECDKYYKDAEAKNEFVGGKPEIDVVPYYTITFIDPFNWTTGKAIRFPKGEMLTLVKNEYCPPEVEGYEFIGWAEPAQAEIYLPNEKMPEGIVVNYVSADNARNIVLNAYWRYMEYEISYKNAGNNSNNPKTYTIKDEINLADPEWQGLYFSRWTDENGNEVTKINKGTTGNIVFEANWHYHENYVVSNKNKYTYIGGTQSSNGNYHFIYDIGTIENVVISSKSQNYVFTWDGNAKLGTEITKTFSVSTEEAKSASNTVGRIITDSTEFQHLVSDMSGNQSGWNFSAKCAPEVEFKGIKGKVWEVSGGYSNTNVDMVLEEETTVKFSSNQTENYYETQMTVSNVYKEETSVTEKCDIVETAPYGKYTYVTAVDFKIYVIITYDPTEDIYYMDLLSIAGEPTKKALYTLTGADVYTVNIESCDPLSFDIPYAQIPQMFYTVEYDANGGEGNMPKSIGEEGVSFNLWGIEGNIKKPGFRFIGWSTTPDGVPVYTDEMKVCDIAKVGETLTLYACWDNEYVIAYNACGGTISGEYSTSYNVDSKNLILPTPVYNSYPEYNHFLGWYVDEKCTTKFTEEYLKTDPGDITLYAKWDLCTVYTSIDSTPWSLSGRVILDWRGESDTNMLNHTRRSVADQRYHNIDISNGTKEVIFIGNKNQTFTNLGMYICCFADGQELTIRFVNFNFVTNQNTAINVYEDKGVNLTIDVVGTCSIKTYYSSGSIIGTSGGKFKNLIIAGSGTINMVAGNGQNGTKGSTPGKSDSGNGGVGGSGQAGGTTIYANRVYIRETVVVTVYGGSGGNGGNGGNSVNKYWGSKNAAGNGGSGGVGGCALATESITIDSTATMSLIGGNGGNGGNGGFRDTRYGNGDKGQGGSGASGGAAISTNPIISGIANITNGTKGSNGAEGGDWHSQDNYSESKYWY